MSEGMSVERLAAIREMNQIEHVNAEAAKALLPLQIGELLAEVERLRGENERQRTTNRDLGKHTMRTMERATAAETEAKQLRARLDEIGETREEWAADSPLGWLQWPVAEESEAFARSLVETAAKWGAAVKLTRRLTGPWREVPDA